MKKLICIPVVAVLALSGCNQRLSNAEMIGMAAGGIVGGFAGAQIGHGVWNMTMAGVGAAGGVATGYVLGRKLEASDMVFYNKITSKQLASASQGQILNWSNPETGNSGVIRPVSEYKMSNGRLCKGYRSTVAFSDEVQFGSGTSCQISRGTWQMISDDFS
jgi:surface antigen